MQLYLVDRILYYGPLSSGMLTLIMTPTETESDTQSGLSHVTFPALFGLEEYNDASSPYERVYPITNTLDGGYVVQALDRVGNAATSTFTVTQDATAPTVHVLLPEQAGLLFEVAPPRTPLGAGSHCVRRRLDGVRCGGGDCRI